MVNLVIDWNSSFRASMTGDAYRTLFVREAKVKLNHRIIITRTTVVDRDVSCSTRTALNLVYHEE
jgi:hypothetical protein